MRIKSIDFLRGLAIILVLFRHIDFVPMAHLIGWSGVDLFFVLSGFLVSGLLFNEYKKTNTIQPFKFLIRRGFKIYPLFWATIIYIIIAHQITGFGTNSKALMAELFFYQNYTYSSLFGVTWSLAVEEHFYILLIISISLAVKFKTLENKKGFHFLAITVLAYCLTARVITTYQIPQYNYITHYTPTHLRIDALTFGVIIAYNYYFNKAWFIAFANKYKAYIVAASLLFLLPLFGWDSDTVFMRTVGFTFIYLGFGCILTLFVGVHNITDILQKFVSKFAFNLVSKIGMYSYAIYLTHLLVLTFIKRIMIRMLQVEMSNALLFVLYMVCSVLVGMLVTYIVEKPMLELREKWFPNTKKKPSVQKIPQLQTA